MLYRTVAATYAEEKVSEKFKKNELIFSRSDLSSYMRRSASSYLSIGVAVAFH